MHRRGFLKRAVSVPLAWCAWSRQSPGDSSTLSNPVGYSTIAWPNEHLDQALETISALGFKGVQLLRWVREAYQGAKAGTLKDRLRRLELQPVALSCWNLTLDPERPGNEVEELKAYASFWRNLGGVYLQVTEGGKPDGKYSAEVIKSLGARMNELGKLAQDYGLTMGYHPHFNTLGETREGLGQVLDATDPRYVKLVPDVAHLMLGGSDPIEVMQAYHERLLYLHFKDVRNDVADMTRKDRNLVRSKPYHFCEVGAGAVDFPGIVRALREVRFSGWVIVELDRSEPAPGGPAASARRNKEALLRLGLAV